MADDGSAQTTTNWPMDKYLFSVKIGNDEILFDEMSGLISHKELIEYSAGSNEADTLVRRTGGRKLSSAIFKTGRMKPGAEPAGICKAAKQNPVSQQTVVISLLDETHTVAMSWHLASASLCNMILTQIPARTGEVQAVEMMEISYEQLMLVS